MKRNSLKGVWALLCVIVISFFACQQEMDERLVNGDSQAATKAGDDLIKETIKTEKEGTLEALLGDKKNTVQQLTITGPLDAGDINCIRTMGNHLLILDMKEVEFVESDTTYYWQDEYYGTFELLKKGRITPGMFADMKLTSLVLPSDITRIERRAFYRCPLTSIDVPEGIIFIGELAFYYCYGLSAIKLLNVEEIGRSAFYGCRGLASIELPSIKTLGGGVFQGCSKLSSVKLSSKLGKIPDNAFQGCPITAIELPESLTAIGDGAFRGCALQSVDIPNSVVSIVDGAFRECSELVSVKLPIALQHIPYVAFRDCNSLKELKIPESVISIGKEAFCNCSVLNDVSFSNNLTSIGYGSFQSCRNFTSIEIPGSVTKLDAYAFASCINITKVVLNEGVTVIGGKAFSDCTSLSEINFPKSVTSIGDQSFYNCVALKSIDLSNCSPKIWNYAFYNTGLTTLTIPETAEVVETGLVSNCANLSSVFWENKKDIPNIMDLNRTNCLIYLSHDVAFPAGWNNIIEPNGIAQKIVLNDAKKLNCPRDFKVKSIAYTRDFGMSTIPGRAAGWETIILPFTVQTIKDQKGDLLAPFGTAGNDKVKKYFWLRQLAVDGTYKDVTTIEANKPYIIAMPNSEEYDAEYNITGRVTFEATNNAGIPISVTPDLTHSPTPGATYSMYGTYDVIPKAGRVYPINESGSSFDRSLRDVQPFEAYVMNNDGSNTRSFKLNGSAHTRSIRPLGRKPSIKDM